MAAPKFDLVGQYAIEKGLPWRLELTRYAGASKTPVDLTGCQARLVLFDALDPAAVPAEFSTQAGQIVLGGATGTFICDLAEEETAAITAARGRYRLYFTDSHGRETLYLRGKVAYLEAGE